MEVEFEKSDGAAKIDVEAETEFSTRHLKLWSKNYGIEAFRQDSGEGKSYFLRHLMVDSVQYPIFFF